MTGSRERSWANRFRASVFTLLLQSLFIILPVNGQSFPELESLTNSDPIFLQIIDDIQAFYRWEAGVEESPRLSIYHYRIAESDTLFSLAARLNLPQASLATINRLDNPDLPPPGSLIRVPNIPGIFIPETAVSDFERILSSRIREDGSFELSEVFRIPGKDGTTEAWRFIVAGDFTSLERRAFLQVLFRDPLPGSRISSPYGTRLSPITGRPQFHMGIDMVAPAGTEVGASAEGSIIDRGFDPIYGNYLSIGHPGGYETTYAHLDEMFPVIGQTVRSGERIGTVGSSGLSTGYHLHFEIRYLKRNRDPQDYIRRD